MVLKYITSAALIPLLAVEAANAERVCETVEEILGALVEVRSIHADGYPNLAPAKLGRLEDRLVAVSLEDVFNLSAGQDAKARAGLDSVIHLIQNSQVALAAYRAGNEHIAASRLHVSIPVPIDQTLSDLQREAQCRPTTEPGTGMSADNAKATPPSAGNTGLDATVERTAGLADSGEGMAGSAGASAQARKGEIQSGPAFNVASNWKTLLGLAGLISAAGLLLVRRNQRDNDRRIEERLICHLPVQARTGKKSFALTIVDFTRHGMKVQHAGQIDYRRVVEIQLADASIKGRVSWYNPVFAGLRLVRPLTEAQFQFASESAEALAADEAPERDT